MPNTWFVQLVHLIALIIVGVMLGLGKGDATVEWTALGTLVGIAFPSPFGNTTTTTTAVVAKPNTGVTNV